MHTTATLEPAPWPDAEHPYSCMQVIRGGMQNLVLKPLADKDSLVAEVIQETFGLSGLGSRRACPGETRKADRLAPLLP